MEESYPISQSESFIHNMVPLRGKQHQISRGDNYNEFYLLTLFDCISITFSHRVWGLELGSRVQGLDCESS